MGKFGVWSSEFGVLTQGTFSAEGQRSFPYHLVGEKDHADRDRRISHVKSRPVPGIPVKVQKVDDFTHAHPVDQVAHGSAENRGEAGDPRGLARRKVFQKIKSPVEGTILEIVAENEKPLKDGDLIFVIEA